eukprot:m.58264 g.58264  ORF g.58264 m.58264 type:complete len:139 (+) comp11254_c1_seq1:136-552(+)
MANEITQRFGRFVPQLRKISLCYCRGHVASSGMREFVEKNVMDIGVKNKQTVFVVQSTPRKDPLIKAQYLNGREKTVNVRSMSRKEIMGEVQKLSEESGYRPRKFGSNPVTSSKASIQGDWNIFLNPKDKVKVKNIAL